MTKYQQGKVYCIKSPHTPNIYIGSTIQPLSYRMSLHNYHYRKHTKGEYSNLSSFDIIKFGDAYIELIENFPCANKEELEKREGEIIRESPDSVNKTIAGRTKQQYYEDNKEHAKQYYEENKETILEKHKQYYQDNKESMREHAKHYREDNKEYYKQYREDNKEYYNQYSKQYRENNKESMKEHAKQYYQDNKEHAKQYYQDNKEKYIQYYQDNKEHAKQYYEDNKESISERYKQYYQDNKESIREKLNKDEVKQYYQTNKIKFKNNLKRFIEKNKAPRVCICGTSYNYGHKQTREKHYKTHKHTSYVLEVRKNFTI